MKAAAVLALALGVAAGVRPPATSALEQEAAAFVASVENAVRQKDRAKLDRMIAEGFQFVHSTGRIEDRESFIQRAAAGQLASQRIPGTVLESRLRVHGDTVVRTVRTSVRMNPADTAAPPAEIWTAEIYVKANGAWRWVFAQSTPVAAPVKSPGQTARR